MKNLATICIAVIVFCMFDPAVSILLCIEEN